MSGRVAVERAPIDVRDGLFALCMVVADDDRNTDSQPRQYIFADAALVLRRRQLLV